MATEEEELRLRMLTPAAKAFAAHYSSIAMEECMAALGGMGYMEEIGFGKYVANSCQNQIGFNHPFFFS